MRMVIVMTAAILIFIAFQHTSRHVRDGSRYSRGNRRILLDDINNSTLGVSRLLFTVDSRAISLSFSLSSSGRYMSSGRHDFRGRSEQHGHRVYRLNRWNSAA